MTIVFVHQSLLNQGGCGSVGMKKTAEVENVELDPHSCATANSGFVSSRTAFVRTGCVH